MRISRARSLTVKEKNDQFFTNIVNDWTLVRRRNRIESFDYSHPPTDVRWLPLPGFFAIVERSISKATLSGSFPKSGLSMYFPGDRRTSFPFSPTVSHPLLPPHREFYFSFSLFSQRLQRPTLISNIATSEQEDGKHSSSPSRISLPPLSAIFQHSPFPLLISTTFKRLPVFFLSVIPRPFHIFHRLEFPNIEHHLRFKISKRLPDLRLPPLHLSNGEFQSLFFPFT